MTDMTNANVNPSLEAQIYVANLTTQSEGQHNQTNNPVAIDSNNYISKMQMHSQETTQSVIDNELLLVGSNHPDATSITYDDEGWDSRVYMVNEGEIVYKFPRTPQVFERYGLEIAALKLLNDLDLGVQTQRFRALDPINRNFSYKGIVGNQLSEMLEHLDLSEKQDIGTKIGKFLQRLHLLELPEAPIVTAADEIKEYQAKYQLSLPVIESSFSASEQSKVKSFFMEEMPDCMQRLGTELRLCHGDLGTYNIIVGDAGLGIMDLGNVGYYDQSKDFIDFGDRDLLEAVFKSYGDTASLRAKTALRIKALPVIDLVYYKNKHDNKALVNTASRLKASLYDESAPDINYNDGGI